MPTAQTEQPALHVPSALLMGFLLNHRYVGASCSHTGNSSIFIPVFANKGKNLACHPKNILYERFCKEISAFK